MASAQRTALLHRVVEVARWASSARLILTMCGRYTVRDPRRCLAEFSILEKAPALEPRFNVAPTQDVWAVRMTAIGQPLRVDRMRWGLAPPRPRSGPVIMVRAETVARKVPFGDAFRRRRCLLIADGFYEWKRTSSQSFPYFFEHPDGRPFAIAAIWEKSGEDGAAADGCALITCAARAPIDAVHHRMPALVSERARERWLDPAFDDVVALQTILGGEDVFALRALPVSARVNSPSNDDAECADAIAENARRGEQFELFASHPTRRSG